MIHSPIPALVLKTVKACRLHKVQRQWGGKYLTDVLKPPAASQGPKRASLRGFVESDTLFVHVPKAAGISVLQALYGNIGLGHTSIREYRDLFRGRFIDRAFVFTFVRNPWDRVYSAYCFLKAGGWPETDAYYAETWLKDCRDFEQFVMEILPQDGAREIVHFKQSRERLIDEDGELYEFDFIGRYETLAKDFGIVRRRVNPRARLVHLNRTGQRNPPDYREVYTSEMIRMVDRFFGESIRDLGYTFNGFRDDLPAFRRGRE